MERFAALFGRYLQEEGPSVDWNRIEKLPSDAVMDYTSLTAPTDGTTVCKIKYYKWHQTKYRQLMMIIFIIYFFSSVFCIFLDS